MNCDQTVFPTGENQYNRVVGRPCRLEAKFEISRPDTPDVIARKLCGRHVATYRTNPFWNVRKVGAR